MTVRNPKATTDFTLKEIRCQAPGVRQYGCDRPGSVSLPLIPGGLDGTFQQQGSNTDWSTLNPLCGQVRMFSTASASIFSSAK